MTALEMGWRILDARERTAVGALAAALADYARALAGERLGTAPSLDASSSSDAAGLYEQWYARAAQLAGLPSLELWLASTERTAPTWAQLLEGEREPAVRAALARLERAYFEVRDAGGVLATATRDDAARAWIAERQQREAGTGGGPGATPPSGETPTRGLAILGAMLLGAWALGRRGRR